METENIKQQEAEKPSQSEVADLSTEVEPMDADDGLDFDPYSPASNLNTEDMKKLLRVEEERRTRHPKLPRKGDHA
ncbi:hypothetical protein ACLKA6_008517 [Drosophila palustris]